MAPTPVHLSYSMSLRPKTPATRLPQPFSEHDLEPRNMLEPAPQRVCADLAFARPCEAPTTTAGAWCRDRWVWIRTEGTDEPSWTDSNARRQVDSISSSGERDEHEQIHRHISDPVGPCMWRHLTAYQDRLGIVSLAYVHVVASSDVICVFALLVHNAIIAKSRVAHGKLASLTSHEPYGSTVTPRSRRKSFAVLISCFVSDPTHVSKKKKLTSKSSSCALGVS